MDCKSAADGCVPFLVKVPCGCCCRIFYICRRCYRNHVYCSKECRRAAYLQQHRLAEREYRKSENGKGNHRKSEKLRRGRSKMQRVISVASKTCACLSMMIQSLFIEGNGREKKGHCIHCGREGTIVEEFPRRGYGKQISKEENTAFAF